MPNGSYQGTQTTASALRSRAGSSARPTRPRKCTRSSTWALRASARSRPTSGSVSTSAASGPPATTSSASGPPLLTRPASAEIALPMPLRSTRRPTYTSRARPGVRSSASPIGRKVSRSTPHGTTEMRLRSPPRRSSSKTSSLQVATMRSHSSTRRRSTSSRSGGLVSREPWWRRFTTPSAWKVMTTGIPSGRAASRAAYPLIQKCACTTSGRRRDHWRRRSSAKASMYGNRVSLETTSAGPAGTWSTVTPVPMGTRRGSARSSRRVCTTTSTPRRPIACARAATCTFCPPASTPPRVASGLACSETMATLTRTPPSLGRAPPRPRRRPPPGRRRGRGAPGRGSAAPA